ncbi:Sec-independent protein translocase protein TatB [Meridianimarinicoccus aquatilis]|uniref:Sec-independent protein translocase protein TatB n=1 Tax=Meridianimarinicoccus aquatilis TaxID=2552766 RepID=A0A4R6AMR1_9RHOB|nr:Sec-independent protein translocase protein TatB [Fluviibacterium aquatile]QIE42686.1 twin-arginine translocase subunit TatB [Rhodobacteraceae bacterium SC52]TDL83828.1 twin-arginine translocase subunit TatB [Fluviibacterium aquatile]
MIDIGWSELLVIGVVALIVVGPKDLPMMFRRLGEFTGKARAMAREFSSAMDKAADEAGVKDIQKDLRAMANPRQTGLDAINKAASDLENWDGEDTPSEKPAAPPPLSPERAEAAAKIQAASAKKATERHEREAAQKVAAEAVTDDKAT